MEQWKSISGYENYRVSNLGNCKSGDNVLVNKMDTVGYLIICVSKKSKSKTFRIHRLVATAFIPNPENKPQVNHKNGVKTDNRVDNLEWVTRSENINHAFKNGLINLKGERHSATKVNNEGVLKIRALANSGTPQSDIATMFKISHVQVYRIVNKINWSHIV